MPTRSIVAPEGRRTQECAVASRTGACLLPLHGIPIRELLDLIERIGKAGPSLRSLGDPLWD
jgi:hypothetical protein